MSSDVTKIEISIAAQVRAKRDALVFKDFTAPPVFHNTKLLHKELAIFSSPSPKISGGGARTRMPPDGLIRGKNASAHCKRRTGLNGDSETQPRQSGNRVQNWLRPPHYSRGTARAVVRLPLSEGPQPSRRENNCLRNSLTVHQTVVQTVSEIQRRYHTPTFAANLHMVRSYKQRQVEDGDLICRPVEGYSRRPRIDVHRTA